MSKQGTGGSRLEKLLKLLDSGTTPATRKAAGDQIANIVKAHPSQLPSILRKVAPCLRSRAWDTRTAAGECLGAVAEHVAHHTPADLDAAAQHSGATAAVACAASGNAVPDRLLSFQNFQINSVLEQGTLLLASGGQEFDAIDEGATPADRLAKQRANLKKRLGLGGTMDQLVDTNDLVKDEDLMETTQGPMRAASSGSVGGNTSATELLTQMDGLSARERNRLKRMAKSLKRSDSSRNSRGAIAKVQSNKKSKLSASSKLDASTSEQAEAELLSAEAAAAQQDQEEWEAIAAGRWPFQRLTDELCMDVLDPAWEVRHGAAIGLREILRSQAAYAAVDAPVERDASGWTAAGGCGKRRLGPVTWEAAAAAAESNATWLEDCVIRIMCILALDRFGDFVSDQVVAPVRETAAQALGAALRPLPLPVLIAVLGMLRQLTGQADWEVRHGGLLAVKYLLAARHDAAPRLLPLALPSVTQGLQDTDDDVRAVAAEALVPVADVLAASGAETVAQLRSILWDILLDLEELSPSTGSVMQLLTHLYSSSSTPAAAALELAELVPRLWPFLRHTLTTVRLACVRCLHTLLAAAEGAPVWLQPIAVATCRLLFQNLLLEQDAAVLSCSEQIWETALARIAPEMLPSVFPPGTVQALAELACTPAGQPLQRSLLLVVPPPQRKVSSQSAKAGRPAPQNGRSGAPGDRENMHHVVGVTDDGNTSRMRLAAAHALGLLGSLWPAGTTNVVDVALLERLSRQDAVSRMLAALAVATWAQQAPAAPHMQPSPQLSATLLNLLSASTPGAPTPGVSQPYTELAYHYTTLQGQMAALLKHCAAAGLSVSTGGMPLQSLSLEACMALALAVPDRPIGEPLHMAKQLVASSTANLQATEALLHGTVTACLAGAVVALGALPPKLNALVQPLMGAVRRDPDPLLQRRAATALAHLICLCLDRKPSPNDRVVKNLCSMATGDPAETPDASQPDPAPSEEAQAQANGHSAAAAEPDPAALAAATARKGAMAALQAVASRLQGEVLQKLPRLWELMSAPLLAPDGAAPAQQDTPPSTDPQAVINALQIVKVVGPVADDSLRPHVITLLPALAACSMHDRHHVRSAAAQCAAALASAHADHVLPPLLRLVVPMLGSGGSEAARRGGVLLVQRLAAALPLALVPYTQLLLVPLMACMSDANPATRAAAAPTFGALVALLPLAQGMAVPAGLDEEQAALWRRDGAFLEQLLDSRQLQDYRLPVRIQGELRQYQQDGINWLHFLRRSGLHGILADDMGLGKTLQATCIIAAAMWEQQQAPGASAVPSLIVCPPTLVEHWPHEMLKFVGSGLLTPLAYQGSPVERAALRQVAPRHNVVVMSYESLRSDIEWVERTAWQYCVLDEGHIIRNPKSKISQACRRVKAQHRLILSGTPIQNNVLEMWALFEFLMPGFLGTERQFNAKFGKALQVAKTSKKGSKEAEAGLLAVEGLHKQVMPFVLRRTKDEVLQDLPPKIIQDLYCSPSPLQLRLYQDFSRSRASAQVASALTAASGPDTAAGKAPHVFQALQYLRKLCSHPLLVLDRAVPEHGAGAARGGRLGRAQQLGDRPGRGESDSDAVGEAGSGHRVLVFAQLKGLLDIVERDVLRPAGISYLRLDGNVEASQRFGLAQRFNADPTIDVMLLTTHVGGLGLNLVAADTVIFLEHDWNPMKDLQAMDRAHRLGQTRAVSVYRLLTRDTLEEKVMGLQRFKLDVAAAVVNADNVSLSDMDTGRLLDLFAVQKGPPAAQPAEAAGAAEATVGAAKGAAKKSGLKSVLEGLEELWDENQYAEEFSLDTFMNKLSSTD